MGAPAIVQGDRISGTCLNHLVPSGSGTAPAPPPQQKFSAPMSVGLIPSVLIDKKAAAVAGASGFNTPPHAGIVDAPFASPTNQIGRIVTGSATVFIGKKAAATTSSQATCCAPATPGKAGPGVPTVLIG